MVDGVEVAQIDCAAGEVTTTVDLAPATEASSISLKAKQSQRVYLKSASLVTGGGNVINMLEGYPRRVGDVSSYLVENVESEKVYYYKVAAYNGSTLLAESNTIELKTTWSSVIAPERAEGIFVYAYNGMIYVDNAPYNAQIKCYSLDGVLCSSRTVHNVRETVPVDRKGIYVVQVITEQASYATRVALN